MIQPVSPGVVVGSLASLYTVCVQRFNSVQLGLAWAGHDEIFPTKLNNQKTRFMSWGQTLGLHDDDRCESIFESPELLSAVVQVLKRMISCLEEIKMFLSKRSLLQDVSKDRKNLGRFLNRFMCFYIRRRPSAGACYTAVDQETMVGMVEELRELINSLLSITGSLGELEQQASVSVCWDAKLKSEFTCVELDRPTSPINHHTLSTSNEVFAAIVEKDSLTRKALLHKLEKDRSRSGGYTDAATRIMLELSQVAEYNGLQEPFSLAPFDGDIFNCLGTIYGPQGTPYDGGIFYLWIKFPTDYPFNPPKIRFLTNIFHPNINADGHICLDVLREKWSPVLTISRMLLSISSFLDDPNPNQSLVPKASKQYQKDKAAYDNNIRMCVKRCTTGELPSLVELREEPRVSLTRPTTANKRSYTYSEYFKL
ncbi:Ubiquitin-conjugating enzyme E2 D2 [Xylographa soralifera]|nr:Ubiquitin-conjugating enzyme E2 D2 [Xylographa soralifera]